VTGSNDRRQAFRDLIERARGVLGPGPILLAEVGKTLRRLDPTFTPSEFGAPRLRALLESVPDVGQIRRRPDGHPELVFHGGGHELDPTRLRVRRPVWNAVTDYNPSPSGWSLDLETLEPVCDPALLASEPERFVSLPDAGAGFQARLLRAFVAERGPALAAAVEQLLEHPDWFRGVRDALGDAWDDWVTHRREAILRVVVEWADAHAIPRRAVVSAVSPRRPPGLAFPAVEPSAAQIRARLHRLIDRMDDDALLGFPVPAWCLRFLDGGR